MVEHERPGLRVTHPPDDLHAFRSLGTDLDARGTARAVDHPRSPCSVKPRPDVDRPAPLERVLRHCGRAREPVLLVRRDRLGTLEPDHVAPQLGTKFGALADANAV